jgi:hypothetical protein
MRLNTMMYRLIGGERTSAAAHAHNGHFVGRVARDEDFSGETGAERRWKHRDCCGGGTV